MRILARCPECSAQYNLSAEHLDREAKCKCGHVFVVTKAADAPGAPGRTDPAGVPSRMPTQSSGEGSASASQARVRPSRGRWVVGADVAAALALAAIGVSLYLFGDKEKDEAPVLAQANVTQLDPPDTPEKPKPPAKTPAKDQEKKPSEAKLAASNKQFSSGIVEGMNNKIKTTARKSHGFGTQEVLQIALYHTLANLPLPPITHRFCQGGEKK